MKKVTTRGKHFYKKVNIIPTKFCNNAKFFPRPKDPKVQKVVMWKKYLQKIFKISSFLLKLIIGKEFLSNIFLTIL